MGDRIVLLGTGTCRLDDRRAASAALIERGALRLVFDFGRGVGARLAEVGLRQDDVEHVVLSHFHADHFSDLIPYLHAASWSPTDSRSRDLHLWGPPGVGALLDRLLGLFPRGELLREGRYRVHAHDTAAGPLTIDGAAFESVSLPPAGNHGLRFEHRGRRYALTGDSHFHDAEVEFLRGADLAVIDAGHLDDDEIAQVAARSGAARIVCSHLYRDLDRERLQAAARRAGFAGSLIVGRDLMAFEI